MLRKRLDCGFNGYRAPVVPRAPRSIRVTKFLNYVFSAINVIQHVTKNLIFVCLSRKEAHARS